MSNYSILQQNTIDGLSDAAGILYLQLCDQYRDERKAFMDACRFDRAAGEAIGRALDNYHHVCGSSQPENWAEVKRSLSQFFSERWRNNFMGR